MASGASRMEVRQIEVCCEPVLTSVLSEDEADDLAAAFKVLADPARLRLLSMVAGAEGGEACACDLVEPVGRSQPTVSHHLSVLTEAGLLSREKRGKWAYYRVVPERLAVLRDALSPVARAEVR
ncbi:MAG TPA: metalloregulator ArsR/SmtB family transcription factor [Acidimicrobiales bacterium]|nr:metalloregulator ArsR/SmtB family transcription factor [Acidimicrobiales bacterium]